MELTDFDPGAEGLAAILDAIPEFVVVIGMDRRLRYVNHVEPGYEQSDFVGMDVNELMPPESRNVFDAALAALRETGEPQEYEVQASLPGGLEGWYRTRMTPFGGGDEVTQVLLISTNITELKNKEEEVSELRTLLPICAWCDRIQNDEGEWQTIERHMASEEHTAVSHGMCPDCSRRQMQDFEDGDPANGNAA